MPCSDADPAYDSRDLRRLWELPRVTLGSWPTPLQEIAHPRIGRVFVKRDDLAGFGGEARSGVKARKLEGLLGYMDQRNIRSLVIPLGNITNLGPDLVATAERLNIRVKLLIVNDPSLPREQRETLFAPLRKNVSLIGRSYALAAFRLAGEGLLGLMLRDGRMVLPPSPSHPSAIAGAARGYVEAMRQAIALHGCLPRAVYVAAAAGSTVAGFGLGEALMRAAGAPRVKICAVKVVPEPIGLWLPFLVSWTARHAGLTPGTRAAISVVKHPRNTVYGRFDAEHVEVCARVRREHGLNLDPVYGGKSWTAMELLEAQGTPTTDRPPLFWHCGYTPDWRRYSTDGGPGPATQENNA